MEVPRVKLGTQGLEVSRLGFGSAGLTGILNTPLSNEAGAAVLKEAFNKGITFFDTADLYANGENEIVVGKALKELPRDKVQIASKFGVTMSSDFSHVVIKGSPEYVRQCIEASLKRLDVDYIDLYYQHRVDTSVPIEETGDDVVPIPGTTKIKNLENNIGSLAVKLKPEDLKEITDMIPLDQVVGEREISIFSQYCYKFANTPTKY